jgi:hypothetical protein
MKKLCLALSFLLTVTQLHSFCDSWQPSIELRGAAFIPTGDLFQDIYGHATGNVQVELATRQDEGCWGLWTNVDFLAKEGNSVGLCKSTKAKIFDISFGFRRFWDWRCLTAALGFGANVGHISLRNCTTCSTNCAKEWGGGFVVKSNLYYDINDCWFLDLFADYTYQQICFTTNKAQIGGFKIGVGFGINL